MCMCLCSRLVDRGILCGRFFFFQAEDGIRDLVRSRGLGDVYKRQIARSTDVAQGAAFLVWLIFLLFLDLILLGVMIQELSLIHI